MPQTPWKNPFPLDLFFPGEMQMYRDIITRLTSEGLFVLPRDNKERMTFAGMDAVVEANRGISPSLMSLGDKLHCGSIELGLLCQPGTCLLPQLVLNCHVHPNPSSLHACPGMTGPTRDSRIAVDQLQTPAMPDRNKSFCYSSGCHRYFRRCFIII